jgi:fumarate reductase subunit C
MTPEAPRTYRAPVSALWWLHRRSYLFFVLRELSSIFVAWSVVFLLLLVRSLAQGAAEYRSFLDWAGTPWVVALNLISLAFLVLHAITWFDLTPAAVAVRLRGRPVPPVVVAGGAYAGWIVVSAVIAALVVTR